MKKIALSLLWAVSMLLTGPAPVLAAGLTFGQVVDGVDGNKNTKLAAKENWKKWKGQEVNWAGTVHEVDSKGKEAKIYITDKSRPLYKGFNIIVVTTNTEKAATLKRGQPIRFKGILDDYRSKDVGAVIEIEKAQIL